MNIFTILLTQPLANGLIVFYRLLGSNMGLAIIGFSLFLRAVLNPLAKPQLESAKKVKELAPRLEKIKKRHKGDRAKIAQAQADLYKEHGVNPLGGCLPQILQLAVLIAFFGVFTRTLYPGLDPKENFNKLLYEPLKFSQSETVNTKFLYLDVTEPDVFRVEALPFPLPGPILLLAALIQFVSAKIMSPYIEAERKVAEKTKEKSDDIQVAMQKSMTYTFPLLTLFIGTKFPAGLAIYWFIFSLWQAWQQYKSSGWGALTPWVKSLGLLKS